MAVKAVTFDLPGRPSPVTPVNAYQTSSTLHSLAQLDSYDDGEAARSLFSEIKATDRGYLNDLSDLQTNISQSDPRLYSLVEDIRQIHSNLPDGIQGLENWVSAPSSDATPLWTFLCFVFLLAGGSSLILAVVSSAQASLRAKPFFWLCLPLYCIRRPPSKKVIFEGPSEAKEGPSACHPLGSWGGGNPPRKRH
jgi:hypothetical protein